MKYLKNFYRKHHKLKEMHSCKVTAKLTSLSFNKGHLLSRKSESHLIIIPGI